MSFQMPDEARKYFWGDDLGDLNWQDHKNYITQTLLEKGDEKAIKWLFSKIDRGSLAKILPQIKLSEKSYNFWNIYLS